LAAARLVLILGMKFSPWIIKKNRWRGRSKTGPRHCCHKIARAAYKAVWSVL
jgi:hypothetical protein